MADRDSKAPFWGKNAFHNGMSNLGHDVPDCRDVLAKTSTIANDGVFNRFSILLMLYNTSTLDQMESIFSEKCKMMKNYANMGSIGEMITKMLLCFHHTCIRQ